MINVTGDDMFHVYVLRSERTGRRYVGSCENFEERFRRHNAGESKASKYGAPWRLLHKESFSTRSEAVLKELYCTTGRGRDELDRLLAEGRSPGRLAPNAAAAS